MIPPCHHQPEATAAVNSYLADHLQFMQEQEETTYQTPPSANYLAYATVTHTDRRTMLDWSYEIVRACAISREIACIGIQYFDRFLCTSSQRAKAALASRQEFQLAFITCLIIALKCRSGMQVDAAFVSGTICKKLYDEEEIVGMERDVLSALQWRLNGPSPHEFIAGMVALLPPKVSHTNGGGSNTNTIAERLTDLAHAQAERVMLDYSTALQQSPSSIAYAALMAAKQSIGTDAFRPLDRLAWTSNIDMVTNRKWKDYRATSRLSSAPKKEVFHCCSAMSSSTADSPVTSSIQLEKNINGSHPYRNVLSIASSRECMTNNYMSPVSSMLEGFQCGN